MAEKVFPSTNVAPYGIAIANALSKSTTTVEELLALRDHVREIVGAQGDLAAAVDALDAEIAGRGTAKSPPLAGERFVVQIEGLSLTDTAKAEIEQALHKAVMAEVARIDNGGDLVATPLSRAKLTPASVGGSLIGHITMGLIAYPPDLR